ncbi:MAG: hypothetical protein AABW92_02125 [Nanoarchaeota archaeon]
MNNTKNIIDFVKQNRKLLLFSIISLIIFNKYIIIISLFILFGLLGILSLQVTRLIPHISIETISSSAILIGYVWGWKLGLLFGISFGLYGYMKISLIKLKTIIAALLMGLCGVIAAIFATLNYSFGYAFIFTFIIKMVLNQLIYPLVESNMTENFIHSFGDPLFNMLITFQLMQIIYKILMFIT